MNISLLYCMVGTLLFNQRSDVTISQNRHRLHGVYGFVFCRTVKSFILRAKVPNITGFSVQADICRIRANEFFLEKLLMMPSTFSQAITASFSNTKTSYIVRGNSWKKRINKPLHLGLIRLLCFFGILGNLSVIVPKLKLVDF